jgi:glycosyltransferase involved in cell wall biosynthesis
VSASVLVLSAEPVEERMAGPAIRAAELARALAAAGSRVTLAAPAAPSAPAVASTFAPPGVRRLEAGFEDFDVLLEAARENDVVLAQELPPTLLGRLRRLPVRLALDLYNPVMVEVLEAVAAEPPRTQRRIQQLIGMRALAQCAVADFIVCASERQRDLWLGGMAMNGLIDLETYRRDPTLRSLIDVVPFGIPDEPPPERGAEPVLKGTWPGIASEDRVLLWAGGIWGWLDPGAPIRAVKLLEDMRSPPTHLVFLGTARPGLERTGQARYAEGARDPARQEGLEGRLVHFNYGWVPYAERGRWLAEANLGVSAHLDHLEARFSFRTRILDYLWAGLPVVTSSGDALGDLVEHERVGRAVSPGDPEAFAAACAALLDCGREERGRIAELRPSLRWSEVTRPLAAWCERAPALRRRRPERGALRRAIRVQYLRTIPETTRTRGLGAAARQIGRRVRRIASRA